MSYIGKDVAPQPQGTYSQSEIDTQMLTKVPKVTSTDNAIVRFDGTTGAVQNSSVVIDDSGNVGIGTSSITRAKVQVYGTTNIPTNDSNAQTHSILLQDTADKPSMSLLANSANSVIYATSAGQYRSSLIHRYNADSGSDCFKVEQLRPSSGDTLERMRIDSAGNLKFDSGYGSAATAYGCRAWVNFNGTGTVAIRASGNVSSITDVGVGNYYVNFTTAMPDSNYSLIGTSDDNAGLISTFNGTYNTTTAKVMGSITITGGASDLSRITVAIFR